MSRRKETLKKSLQKIDRERLSYEMWRAFREARKGKTATGDEFSFEVDRRENLERLIDEILAGEYKLLRGIRFIISDPVVREIFAAPFRDRVVHHYLYNRVVDWWDVRLINNSFSCRKGKGVLCGIQSLQKDMLRASKGSTEEVYAIKMDIQGYFMSLSRKKLFERINWGLKRQFPHGGPEYQLLKYLWGAVIFDDPVKGVRTRDTHVDPRLLPDNKSLLNQPEGQGIVIGNLTSQLLSNIYLDQLDRFVTMTLGYKYYGRYVDDFYIIVPESQFEQAKKDIKVIDDYLVELGLTLHPRKRYVQNVRNGVPYLGAVVYPHKILPGKRFQKKFRMVARDVLNGEKDIESIVSYLGYCKHADAKKLCHDVFAEAGWEYRY